MKNATRPTRTAIVAALGGVMVVVTTWVATSTHAQVGVGAGAMKIVNAANNMPHGGASRGWATAFNRFPHALASRARAQADAGGCDRLFAGGKIIATDADGSRSAIAADLDGDGDEDVLWASAFPNKIAWSENIDGQDSFGPVRIITTAVDRPSILFAADLDGDGDMDVLSGSQNDTKIAWYENTDGLGTFGAQQIISTTVLAQSISARDVDGDGDTDVVSTSSADATVAWYENTNGQGAFGPAQVIIVIGTGVASVSATDLNGDGNTDYVSASSTDHKIAWYQCDGHLPAACVEQVISTNAVGASSVFVIDLDGDGDKDVLSASVFDNKIAWYENTDGLGAFGPQQVIATDAIGSILVVAADLDGDGDADVLSSSNGVPFVSSGSIAWYENIDGLGTFGPRQVLKALSLGQGQGGLISVMTDGLGAASVFPVDLDSDGDADILSQSSDGRIAWFESEPDCNGNGVNDGCDIANGVSLDCSANGTPDECEEDCNGNGAGDSCDLVDGTSQDCNGNLVPDSCDVGSGLSLDCNTNGTPDECELDCNGNDVPDDCEIADDPSLDLDCGGNGIPDDCEANCNGNLVADSCDISNGTSQDCNGNGIPDECAFETDCNNNTVPDSCDIADGTSPDCTGNGIPDECESNCNGNLVADSCDIADGTSQDCNDNAIPDSCDIADTTSLDCDLNGVPDECEPDCNGNLVADACDLSDGTSDDCNTNFVPDECDVNPMFSSHTIIGASDDPGTLSAITADLDGDGDEDVVSASFNGIIAWFENTDGLGNFGAQQVIATDALGAVSVFAADVDGDGDLDVLSASFGDSKVAWYENTDGLGTFGLQQVISAGDLGAASVFAADLDGDGDTDVLSASQGDNKIAWYENTDGLGTFAPPRVITTAAERAYSVFAVDLDGDGDTDVLSASILDNKIAWYENTDGLGAFGPQQIITTNLAGAISVIAEDLDGDEDYDIVATGTGVQGFGYFGGKIVWFENMNGKGTFGPPQVINIELSAAVSVSTADLDGDGDSDLLSASLVDSFGNGSIAWYENTDGLGAFGPQQVVGMNDLNGVSVFAGDIDGDGESDILSTFFDSSSGRASTIVWYENSDGLGNFGQERLIKEPVDNVIGASSVFAADIDGDGDVDALSASAGNFNSFVIPPGTIAWYENTDGSGDYGRQQIITTDIVGPVDLLATDMDGDGDMDVLSASLFDTKIAWYENIDGQGTFGEQQVIHIGGFLPPISIFAADIDGDGDTDVLSASSAVFSSDVGIISWYENTGGLGNFAAQQIISAEASGASSVFAADLDGDGDLDVLSASVIDKKIAWYENADGLGTFGPQRVINSDAGNAAFVFAADIDGDGDADVVSASAGTASFEGVYSGGNISWYENTDGLGTFGPQRIVSGAAEGAHSVLARDMDGDGDIDVVSGLGRSLLFGSFGGNPLQVDKIAWHENIDGLGSFGPPLIITAKNKGAASIFAADVDHDGDVDVLAASFADSEIVWYENGRFSGDCNLNDLPDECDIAAGASDNNMNGTPDECELFADCDGSGAVDLGDARNLVDCVMGPAIPVNVTDACRCADLNDDGFVDLRDMALFMQLFGAAQ